MKAKLLTTLFIASITLYDVSAQTSTQNTDFRINYLSDFGNKLEAKYFPLPLTKTTIKQNAAAKTHYGLANFTLQLDSIISQNTTIDSVSFDNSSKKNFIYDASNRITEETNANWNLNLNQWSFDFRNTYQYINGDTLLEDIKYLWDTTQLAWASQNKHTYAYTANGKLNIATFYNWNKISNQWVGSSMDIYDYGLNDNMLRYTRDAWDTLTSAWIHQFKHEYAYDPNNNKIQNIRFIWDTILNQWDTSFKVENVYDLSNNLILTTAYNWNSGTTSWDVTDKIEISYNVANKRLEEISFLWNTSTMAWDSTGKLNHTYDLSMLLLSTQNNMYFGYWEPLDRMDYSYDASANKTQETYSFWDIMNLIWEPNFKTEYYSFISNYPTETLTYNWDIINTTWVPGSKERQAHDTSYLYADIAFPWYYGQDLFHHKLDNINFYAWDAINIYWTLGTKSTYYYSNLGVGLNEITTIEKHNAYPNPTTDVIYFKNTLGNSIVKIYNSTGALVMTHELIGNNSFSIATLTSGIYFYELTNNNKNYSGKIIKE